MMYEWKMTGLLGKPPAWTQVSLKTIRRPHVKLVLPRAHLTGGLTTMSVFFWYSQIQVADSKEEIKGEPNLRAYFLSTNQYWGNLFLS